MKNIYKLPIIFRKEFNYDKSIVFDEKDFKVKGTKFQIVYFRNNTPVKPHYHLKTTELFYVISGTGYIRINKKMTKCSAGDAVVCKPKDIHAFGGIDNFTIAVFKVNETKGDNYDVEI